MIQEFVNLRVNQGFRMRIKNCFSFHFAMITFRKSSAHLSRSLFQFFSTFHRWAQMYKILTIQTRANNESVSRILEGLVLVGVSLEAVDAAWVLPEMLFSSPMNPRTPHFL